MDDSEASAPSCFGEEIDHNIGHLLYPVCESGPEIFIARRFKGPIYDQRPADDIVSRHKPPEAAVLAVIPVVSHGKIAALGHVVRAIALINAVRIDVLGIVLFECLTVDVNGSPDHFNFIPGHANQALDVSDFRTVGVFENNDITALRIAVRQQFGPETRLKTIDEFIDQQVIADQKIGFHRSRGDLERLDYESGCKQRNDGSDDYGLEIFPDSRFAEFQLAVLQIIFAYNSLRR